MLRPKVVNQVTLEEKQAAALAKLELEQKRLDLEENKERLEQLKIETSRKRRESQIDAIAELADSINDLRVIYGGEVSFDTDQLKRILGPNLIPEDDSESNLEE